MSTLKAKGEKEIKKGSSHIFKNYLLTIYWHNIDKNLCTHEANGKHESINIVPK